MPNSSPINVDTVPSVRGSVVEIRFENSLPPIYSMLHTGPEQQIVIEVLEQRDAHCVRGIALTSTQELAHGLEVMDIGGRVANAGGPGILSRMFDVFGNAIDRGAALSDVH
ncbi:hypothetical protein ACO0LO_20085 [Undibacterium sp. TJN25]|uniref:hypothetical protein n=1 Tax=Undibacterium sp. TJN25 TaxID=3413056 RepID=UPI003BF3858F